MGTLKQAVAEWTVIAYSPIRAFGYREVPASRKELKANPRGLPYLEFLAETSF